MKKRIFGGLLATVMALPMLAQSGTNSPYSQYGLGLLTDQSQGFNRGMNGVGMGLRMGNIVNTLNPASYSAVDSLTMIFDVGLSGQVTNFKEGGKRINANNADFEYAVGLFRAMPNLGVSFGVLPYSNIGYQYTASTYLDNTIGSITETYQGSGGLHQVFLGAGWRVIKPLSVGVNVAYLWGKYDRSVSSTATTTVNSLSKIYEASVNSYNITAGVQWEQPINRDNKLTLGATLGLGHKLGADPSCSIINVNTSTLVSDTTTFTVDNGLELPMTYGVGASWNHKDKLLVAADVMLQKWGSLAYPSYDDGNRSYALRDGLLKDRMKINLGADFVPNATDYHRFLYRLHYRVGLGYTTPYYKINGADGPKEFSVSAGLGVPFTRSMLNVSAQWAHASATDMITENIFRINIGLTFNERWFAKWRID